MGLFQSYEQQSKPAAKPSGSKMTAVIPAPAATTETDAQSQKKNRPTPSRKESQAARMESMHPKLTKKEKQHRDQQAQAKRNALANQQQENQPERTMMRNYVDSRWSLTEFMLPIVIIIFVPVLLFSYVPALATAAGWVVQIATIVELALVAACLVNIVIFWRGFKDELWIRHPGAPTKGLLMSMMSRMIAMRRFRMPGVAVERGGAY
jgi:cation transport ATPase